MVRRALLAALVLSSWLLTVPAPVAAQAPDWTDTSRDTYRGRSWVSFDPSAPFAVTEGRPFEVTVHYQLDAAETPDGKTATLAIEGVGPWRGPKHVTGTRGTGHYFYPRLRQNRPVEVGRGKLAFRFTAPACVWRDEFQLIALLIDSNGRTVPVQSRTPTITLRNVTAPLVLDTTVPGNLFTYDEPVVVRARLRNLKPNQIGAERRLSYTVRNITGRIVHEGARGITSKQDEEVFELPLALAERGTFLVSVDVPGVGKAETMLCRVPDVVRLTGPKGRTQFGGTGIIRPSDPVELERGLRAVRRLGWSASRSFYRWRNLEPLPGEYALDRWETPLGLARQHGIDTVLTVTTPPVWARREDQAAEWAAVPKWDAWERLVRAVTTRFKGRLYGWEWLNEITPGGWWKGSAAEYAQLCRIGTRTAKGIDPDVRTFLAGGLWPRSFRLDVLGAGAGKYVDVLPLHYNSAAGVRQARADLDMHGLQRVAVWDNESSRPAVRWMEPLETDLADTTQSEWLLEQWPGELVAGAERIIWFGYRSVTGGWSPFYDDLTPRPVAATMAVLVSKLHGAAPLGTFRVGRHDVLNLFERDGRAVLVARGRRDETIRLPVGGAAGVTVTDSQGNERRVAARDGAVDLKLGRMGQFVESADLDALKVFTAVQVGRAEEGVLTSADRGLVDTAASQRVPVLRGQAATVPVVVCNPFDRPIEVTMTSRTGRGESSVTGRERRFKLGAREARSDALKVAVPRGAPTGDREVQVVFTFTDSSGRRLPQVTRRVVLGVIAPDMLGNRFGNGGFETDADANGKPDEWRLWSTATLWAPSGNSEGTGARCIRLVPSETSKWSVFGSPSVAVSPGQKYLYSAWVWSDGMGGGSNINQTFRDGTRKTIHEPRVFGLRDTRCWQLYTKVYHAPAGVQQISVSPVVSPARPEAFALYDNMRLTLYQGTDFAAECHRRKADVKLDGRLDEWVKTCPVPLLGSNQLERLGDDYAWSPANLSAVGYLMWDDDNLYVALAVRDDRLTVTGDAWQGGDPTEGDCVRLAIDPARGSADAAPAAFELQVARGTGGRPLVVRPEARAGGLRAGHLYRDSSEMEVVVVRHEAAKPDAPGNPNAPRDHNATPTDPGAKPPARNPPENDANSKRHDGPESGREDGGGQESTPSGQRAGGATGGATVYEMRIPFSQLGQLRGSVGRRFGLTILLTDNDGAGPSARMAWGRGVHPAWAPAHFGCVTFVE